MMMKMMKLRSGLSTARMSIFRRFVTSPPAKFHAMRFGDVSRGLAAEDLVFDEESAPATAVKADMLPTLLQPRVVVYDGVCRLCHGGLSLILCLIRSLMQFVIFRLKLSLMQFLIFRLKLFDMMLVIDAVCNLLIEVV
ncbi:hypothetical protein HanPI659440_Chr12g0478711 [Helianthus annuus]|nr:hypothetical protein HanPI659440_Chr12g0478711 [Helianthus annuus]